MQEIKLSDVAARVGGDLVGDRDPVITGYAGIDEAGPGDLTFLARSSLTATLEESGAAGVLVGPGIEVSIPAVRVENPYQAFASLLMELQTPLDRVFPVGVHPTAVVDETADITGAISVGPYCVIGPGTVIGEGARLGPHVVVGCDVTIGRDCVLYSHVTLREGTLLGDRVVIRSGCVIGSDGFGYLTSAQGLQEIPQVGIVEIQDGVELGADVCIDRATIGRTVVGTGSKIDNQVQIGHNVRVGKDCTLCAQVGIAGSVKVGDGVIAAGQVGIADHLTIGKGSRIGAQAGLMKDVEENSTLFGTPAMDIKKSMRMTAAIRRLPELLRRVAKLEKSVSPSEEGQE